MADCGDHPIRWTIQRRGRPQRRAQVGRGHQEHQRYAAAPSPPSPPPKEWKLWYTANDAVGNFGQSATISADGARFACGGHNVRRANQYYGAAQVYERYGDGQGEYREVGAQIQGEFVNQRLGRHLALSGDGTKLAVHSETGHQHHNTDFNGLIEVYAFHPSEPATARAAGLPGAVSLR